MRTLLKLTLSAFAVLSACATSGHHTQSKGNTEGSTGLFASDLDDAAALSLARFDHGAVEAPIKLTTPDGIDLKLVSLEAKSLTEGPLAFTELHLAFDNPEARTIEARFAIRLPTGASVSRFAMRINNDWQEGEMVEKQRARQIYEDFLHRKVDPALLEQGAGNEFTARVFPIAAKQRKELIISYSQELTDKRQTLVPLRGLPAIDKLDVQLVKRGDTQPRHAVTKAKHTPKRDFSVLRSKKDGQAVRHGNLIAARVTVDVGAAPEPVGNTLFLIDTSASRALGLRRQLNQVRALTQRIAKAHGSTTVSLASFDQEVFHSYTGPASGLNDSHFDAIRRQHALGASDPSHAFRWAHHHCKHHQLARVVVVGDGVVTAGSQGKALLKRIRALGDAGVERLDVVAFGGILDEDEMSRWATAGLPKDGMVQAAKNGTAKLWARLNKSVVNTLPVTVTGARWHYPKRLRGVQTGDTAIVYAEMKRGKKPTIELGAQKLSELRFETAARPLLARSWAQAKVRSLIEQERRNGSSQEIRKEIIRLSTKYRVLSPHTGMLVLETQRDYDRYNLSRDALADILSIDGGELEVVQRTQPASMRPKLNQRLGGLNPAAGGPLPARGQMWGDSIGESFGAGGLGLSGIGEGGGRRAKGTGMGIMGTIGHGATPPPAAASKPSRTAPPRNAGRLGQGFGSGSGRLGGSRRTPPRVRMGAGTVKGGLAPEVVRRIVRQNFGRLRLCYERELAKQPSRGGDVMVRFSIARNGKVAAARALGSSFSEGLLKCVSLTFRRLSFPRPDAGVVTVAYPIRLTPGGAVSTRAAQRRERARHSKGTGLPNTARPYRGRLAKVMDLLARGDATAALTNARRWQTESPGKVPALIALGEALEANGDKRTAARAYGSIIDLFPSRADMRRYAAERLDRLNTTASQSLAVDAYKIARTQRPDHPTSHRLLAYSLVKQGHFEQAFEAVAQGLNKARFRNDIVRSALKADLGLLGAAWLHAQPAKRTEVVQKLKEAGATLATQPSTRFVLSWETDANDVDLHIYTPDGYHASYASPTLADGSRLYGDVTTGYGPEVFEVKGALGKRTFKLQAHYYSRGAMGFGMGKLQVIKHDGKGAIELDERPFIVMVDKGYVDLGTVGEWPADREEP